MATELAAVAPTVGRESTRRLVLVWQDPATRGFTRVGHLDELVSGRFAFAYDAGAHTDGFVPLAEFPDLERPYVTDRLPAFFGNRVMDTGRGDYADYRGWLGLSEQGADTPFEVLVRTGGGRATDTFHVVEDLRADGPSVTTRFFVSGIRHVAGAAELVSTLRANALLTLRPDRENRHNPLALLLDAVPGRAIGFVPDWLVEQVCGLLDTAGDVEVVVDQVNPEAAPHLRVLCRLTASHEQ